MKNLFQKCCLLTASVILLSNVISYAQTKSCDCRGPLSDDLVDVVKSSQYRRIKDFLYRYFDSDKEHRSIMKKEEGGSFTGDFGIVIEGLPLEARSTAEYQKNDFNQVFDRLRQTFVTNKYLQDDELNTLFARKMSDTQLKSYEACLNACVKLNALNSGLSTIVGGDLSGELFIQVNFNSAPAGGNVVLKSDAIFTNLEPIGQLVFKEKLVINDRDNIIQYFKRINPEKTSSFALNVAGINFEPVVLPDVKVVKGNPSSIPLGTIVVSVLDYATFLKANDFENQPDMEKVIWVPCDGRSLGRSKYSSYASNVPDLRGLFIRGMNDYGVSYPGVTAVPENQKNTEAKAAGEIQYDGVGGHNHKLGIGSADASTMIPNGGLKAQRLPDFRGDNFTDVAAKFYTDGNSNATAETRPRNRSVFYYIKIN